MGGNDNEFFNINKCVIVRFFNANLYKYKNLITIN